MNKPLDIVSERQVREWAEPQIARLQKLLELNQPEELTSQRRGEIRAYRAVIAWLEGKAPPSAGSN